MAAALALLAACGPEPTPLPVVPVAVTSAREATAEVIVETLVVDALTLDLLPAGARARLEASAAITIAPAPLTNPGPSAVSVLPFAGGLPGGYALTSALRVNPDFPPLTDAAVAEALTTWLTAPGERVAEAAALRAALANAGYPDGIMLSLATEPALRPLWAARLDGGPVRWTPAAAGADAHLTLAAGSAAEALLADGGIALDGLPLYASGWLVTADRDSLPVLTRDG